MTNDAAPVAAPKPWIWIVIAGLAVVASVPWLWSMTAPRVCILIYPAPPGCATLVPNWLPFVSIGIILALFVALIVLSLVRRPVVTRPLVILTIAIALVALLTALVMGLASIGTFDAPQPIDPNMEVVD